MTFTYEKNNHCNFILHTCILSFDMTFYFQIKRQRKCISITSRQNQLKCCYTCTTRYFLACSCVLCPKLKMHKNYVRVLQKILTSETSARKLCPIKQHIFRYIYTIIIGKRFRCRPLYPNSLIQTLQKPG